MSLVLILLLIGLFIVVATAHFKLNPFLTLLCAAFIAAFAHGLPLRDIESTIRGGFGNIMGNIGLVIVLGTLIGVILERSGAAITMARSIIGLLGERFVLLAAFSGLLWAHRCRHLLSDELAEDQDDSLIDLTPILLPILLICLGSAANFPTEILGRGALYEALNFLGKPMIALLVGLGFALLLLRTGNRMQRLSECTETGLKISAPILLVTGAGGAFGAVLAATPLGDSLGSSLSALGLGLVTITAVWLSSLVLL